MAKDVLLESSAVSAFCGSMATMLSAGIQVDEALHMLSGNQSGSYFREVCTRMYQDVAQGKSLAEAMVNTHAFPSYAQEILRIGERAGRTEEVLRNLDTYYEEEANTIAKLKAAVGYPAALLCIMSIILAFTVSTILPIFVDVYNSMSGSLTSGSFSAVGFSMVIGWVALGLTLVFTALALALALLCRSETGRLRVVSFFEGFGPSKDAMYQLALSRFTSSLSTYISSGLDSETAVKLIMETVTNKTLKQRLNAAYAAMIDTQQPLSLAQAIEKFQVFPPLYARMMQVGSSTGSTDEVLARLSITFFDDSLEQIDQLIALIEPVLAAFLTVSVGTTLISVMLPLIGIMRSIG